MILERKVCLSFTPRTIAIGLATIFWCTSPRAEGNQVLPRASCGPGDRPEQVQGQTTISERFSATPSKAYTCNLELIGQFEGEGADAGLDALEDCAYYSTAPNTMLKNHGVVVLDVKDSRHPKAAAYLSSPAMLHAHKSLAISQARKLLLASRNNPDEPSALDIYDVSNCRQPVLRSSVSLPGGILSHMGNFSPDGLTYYGAPFDFSKPLLFALDTTNPSQPRILATWSPPKDNKGWTPHSAVISADSTRAYVSMKRMSDDQERSINPNGLAIFDISDIQARRFGPRFKLLGSLFWEDTHGAGGMATFRTNGHSYLIFSDTLGATGFEKPVKADACDSGKPGHGFGRIIDISDERHPKLVSTLMLEVSDPKHCSETLNDPTLFGSYGSFACSVNNAEAGKLLACAHAEAGLRVFDISDVAQPREIAYYKPPGRRTEDRPGSLFRWWSQEGATKDFTTDPAFAAPLFRDNSKEIWFTSIDNGFQIVRFSDHFASMHENLFIR
jgi:hypothetical protein